MKAGKAQGARKVGARSEKATVRTTKKGTSAAKAPPASTSRSARASSGEPARSTKAPAKRSEEAPSPKSHGAKPRSSKAQPKARPRTSRNAPRSDESSAARSRTQRSSAKLAVEIQALEAELDRRIEEASRRDVTSMTEQLDAGCRASEVALPLGSPDAPPVRDDVRPQMSTSSEAWVSPLPSGPLPTARPSFGDLTTDLPGDDEPGARPGDDPSGSARTRGTARELLSPDFYLRTWGRLAMRGRSEEVDDFGYDPSYDARVRSVLDFLYGTYFRVETHGIEHVPKAGRAVLVANHSGTVPLDGLMLKTALRREHTARRAVRWLTEDFIYHFPYLGSAMNRLGAVRACQENAERLLAQEKLVAVFPEGTKGIGKLFADRYRLQRFGRGGFVKLCLRTSTPIVPVAIVGAEETNPMLFRIERLSRVLGLPYVPITPTFPWLGPAGLLPAPTKWKIHFGEAIDVSSHGPGAADDDLLVARLAERVRGSIQTMLDELTSARKSVFFG